MSTISLRITENEHRKLKSMAEKSGLSVSSFIKKRVFDKEVRTDYNMKPVIEILTDMATNINRLKRYETAPELCNIERGCKKIWQTLL
ncbi:MAG: DUF6290 family protein [Clostridia bacterium]|nr:DUF6290 family protein [Clostridia bacterium]